MNSVAAKVPDLTARVQGLVNTGAKFFGEGQLEPARLHFLAALSLDSSPHGLAKPRGHITQPQPLRGE
jgi:hypothetical protein